jgi:hypothetical protein
LADLDGDGRLDILSGSWPGEIYFFRRQAGGTFAASVKLTHRDGKEINVGHASAAFAADLDGDGRLDLVIGTLRGEVVWLPGSKGKDAPCFGESRPVLAGDKPIKVGGDAAPVVADWDGDGKLDLLVGAEDGSIVWHRNAGTKRSASFESARPLVAASKESEQAGRPGRRAKFCVVDWHDKGRLDLLLGDVSGYFEGKPSMLDEEKESEASATRLLPGLRKKWAARFAEYEKARDAEDEASERRAGQLREEVKRLKDEIARLQEIQVRFRPQHQMHGFVWLFRRNLTR